MIALATSFRCIQDNLGHSCLTTLQCSSFVAMHHAIWGISPTECEDAHATDSQVHQQLTDRLGSVAWMWCHLWYSWSCSHVQA